MERAKEIKQIHHVSFSGGGVKGISYIGILKALQEYSVPPHVKSWTGVSIGSLFALLGCLNIPWKYILNEAIQLDYNNLVDIDIHGFFDTQGIIKGKQIDQLILKATKHKITHKTTFQELHKLTNKILYIVAYSIDKEKSFMFSVTHTPDICILDAIKASCSVPIFLPPKIISGKSYYDGGLLETAAISHLPSLGTVVWNIEGDNPHKEGIFNDFKILKIITSLRNIILKTKDNSEYIIYKAVSEERDNFLNFSITRNEIFNIFMKNYINTKNQLFKDFIALPAVVPERGDH